MKVFSIISIYAACIATTLVSDLETYRSNYSKAATNKIVCQKMITNLEKVPKPSPLEKAYLGGFQTIYAKHVTNPITKLKTFNRGKKNIEEAVEEEPKQIEIRFIRHSVQKNAPAFLGYRSNLKEDREFIKKNIDQVNSLMLRTTIEQLIND